MTTNLMLHVIAVTSHK